MDIVLPVRFNNPRLPVVERPGYYDDFDRPEADTLGSTSNGRRWETLTNTGALWGTTGTGAAALQSSGSQFHAAVADALTADGTLTTTIEDVDQSAPNRRFGLAFRAQDWDNLTILAPVSSSNHELRISDRVDGVTTALSGIGPVLSTGDTVTVRLDGTTVTVEVNGANVLSQTITARASATKHGLYAFADAGGRWESIEFTPA